MSHQTEIQNLRNQVKSLQQQLENTGKMQYELGRSSVMNERLDDLTRKARNDLFACPEIKEAVIAQAWHAQGKEIRMNDKGKLVGVPDGVPEGFDLDAAIEAIWEAQIANWDNPGAVDQSDDLTVPPVVAAFRAGLGS